MFECGIGGQHNVGIGRGVAPESVVHHGEQVLARQAFARRDRVRHAVGRIGVPAEQRLDRRAQVRIAERVAQLDHVDGARLAPGQQIGALQFAQIHPAHLASGGHAHAALAAHRPGDNGQQLDRLGHHPAVVVTLYAPVQADEGLFGAAVEQRQLFHVRRRYAGDRFDPFERILGKALLDQFLPTHRVVAQEIKVMQSAIDDDFHHAQRQRRIGAGPGLDMPVSERGGTRYARIDGDDFRAVVARRIDEGHRMHAGGHQIGAPQDHHVHLRQVFDVGIANAPEGMHFGRGAGGGADGAL